MADDPNNYIGPGGELNDEGNKLLTKLWRVWRTVNEMLVDRGYEISEEEVTISRDDFQRRFSDHTGLVPEPSAAMIELHTPSATAAKPNPSTNANSIWVEFSHEQTVGVKQLRPFAHYLVENSTNGIFITMKHVTPGALKAFEPLTSRDLSAEHFNESQLLVNITRHELVPKHVLLSGDEKKTLLARYRLKETQLPRIQWGDPVARYLGLKRGQVVKIIRKSETAGRYASYRWVF